MGDVGLAQSARDREMLLFWIGFDSPGVANHHTPGRQEVAFIDIIRDKTMGNRCRA